MMVLAPWCVELVVDDPAADMVLVWLIFYVLVEEVVEVEVVAVALA